MIKAVIEMIANAAISFHMKDGKAVLTIWTTNPVSKDHLIRDIPLEAMVTETLRAHYDVSNVDELREIHKGFGKATMSIFQMCIDLHAFE